MTPTHRNWHTGLPCDCPYTAHLDLDPTLAKVASNLDQLKSPKQRPDLQTPEGQKWLEYLESQPPKVDAIAPWMTREWKRGRLLQSPSFDHEMQPRVFHDDPNGGYLQPNYKAGDPVSDMIYNVDRIQPTDYPNGRRLSLAPASDWADWHHSEHPNKEGVNIQDKNFQVPQMQQKVQEYQDDLNRKEQENYGDVVHRFPDDWTVRQIRNGEEAVNEGRPREQGGMGHCMSTGCYNGSINNGELAAYSLRDPRNEPHATWDITPKRYQDPQSGQVYGPEEADEMEHFEGYNMTPIPNQGTLNHIFGKKYGADTEAPPEIRDRIRQYMETMPEEERPVAESEDEVLGPQTVEDLRDFNENPEAWQAGGQAGEAGPRGFSDPTEYGLAGESLVKPDYSAIVRNHYREEPYSNLIRDQDQYPENFEPTDDFPEFDPEEWDSQEDYEAEHQDHLDELYDQQEIPPEYQDKISDHEDERNSIYNTAVDRGEIPELGQGVDDAHSYASNTFAQQPGMEGDYAQEGIDAAHAGMLQLLQPHWNPEAQEYRNEFYFNPEQHQQQQQATVGYNPAQNIYVMQDPNHPDQASRLQNVGTAPWQGPNTPNVGNLAPTWVHRNPPPGFVPNDQASQAPQPQTSFSHIFDTPAPPPKSQKLGNTTLEWEQTDKGAVMRITGDTHEDRALGRLVLASELARAGIELAQIPMDHDPKEPLGEELARIAGISKEASWDDIMQKAKRILDSGGVQLLRNGYNNIVAQVQGDHGNYQTEMQRQDPNSRSLTGWSCECPWNDYAFGRTRQWKKYESRPCAHCLASWWASQATPLDEDIHPATQEQHVPPGTLPGQGEPGGGHGMGPGGETQPSLPGMQTPVGQQPEPQPGDQTSLFDQAMQRTPSLQNALQALDQAAQPQDPGIIPPNPMPEEGQEQMAMGPGQLSPGEPPPPNMISVPGARPQTPQNPIQIPSTLSSWQENWKISDEEPTNSAFQSGDAVRLEEPTYGVAQGKSEEHGAGGWQQIPRNSIGEVRGQDPTTGWVEAHFPLNNSGPMEPYAVKMFLEPHQVSAAPNAQTPFVKRR